MTDSDDCGILAIATTTQTVRALLERLVKDVVLDAHPSAVPWTIVNKYYTAKVQFLVHTLSSWAAIQDQVGTPALLFIWNRGEPYRDHICELSRHASQREFEVALAVRLSAIGSNEPAEVEDDQDIDAYLSSNGFEFVDVPDNEATSSDRSGILGIPRIIDALSTIMWPSMVRHTSKAEFIGGSHLHHGISSDDYHNLERLVGERISGNHGDRMQQELDELEHWLDEDMSSNDVDVRSAGDDDETVPWSTAATPGTLSPSSNGFLGVSRPTTPKAGFDDDFTSFVSASLPDPAGITQPSSDSLSRSQRSLPLSFTSFETTFNFYPASSGRSTPTFDDHGSIDAGLLPHDESYKPLGSVSDFGDPDQGATQVEQLSNEADEDMPSQAEIADTSRRIFGAIPVSFSPTQERAHGSVLAATALGRGVSHGLLEQEVDVEMTDADLERFDLQGVLGALRGLKEEIAAMPDKERRKAAARVALGLAYGLHGSPHPGMGEGTF